MERLLRSITGCEAASIVNNNAGATLITLAALAHNKQVIVSRGQLVEIGGSYRLPEVMKTSGARLREVGTTNKTRLADYEEAVEPDTAALLHVHTSNYSIQGFSETTPLSELIALGHKTHTLVIDDIGSGALWDFSRYGVAGEPRPQESIRAGADVVLFSGDKLLGGPQCGIILGKRELIQKINKHPLARALRVEQDHPRRARRHVAIVPGRGTGGTDDPLAHVAQRPAENLKNRAERLAPQLAQSPAIASAEPIQDQTYLGGGSMPNQTIATWCVALKASHENVDALATRLRTGLPAVCGRVQNDALLLDLRTVFPRQDTQLVQAVTALTPKTSDE